MSVPSHRPAKRRVVLGINLGLSSVEVVALDLMGLVTARACAEFPVISLRPRWIETGPHAWIEATAAAVRQCMNEAEHALRPIALGISGAHGVVLADDRGEPVRPAILWPDMRATGCTGGRPRMSEASRAGMTGPTLEWLAHHEPGNWARTRWALQPKDWLRAHLTEEFCTEPSDASKTLLYDLNSGSWSAPMLSALDITPAVRPTVLPAVLASSSDRSGYITKRGAEVFGIPARIPVAAGAADTAAAALASGLVEIGQAKLIIGDGAQLVTSAGERLMAPAGSVPGAPVYRAATDHGWYTLTEVNGAGRTLDWVQRVLGASWLELHACAAIEPKADDPLFVPHLNGERAPGVNASGAGSWSGIREHHDRQDLLRSALEGVAFSIKNGASHSPSDHPHRLRLSGRSSVGENWQQLLADVLDCPLDVSNAPDGPEVGAALLGAAAAGIPGQKDLMGQLNTSSRRAAEPNLRLRALYRQRHETFNHIIAALTARSEPGRSPRTPHPATV